MRCYSGLLPIDIAIDDEIQSIAKFVETYYAKDDMFMKQLRAMWAALCLRFNLMVDTSSYDNYILLLHDKITHCRLDFNMEFSEFDDFMCGLLV